MNIQKLSSKRIVHSLVLSILVGICAFRFADGLFVSNIYLVGALAPIVAWMLGRQFERAVVLNAGLVDEDDLAAAERQSMWR